MIDYTDIYNIDSWRLGQKSMIWNELLLIKKSTKDKKIQMFFPCEIYKLINTQITNESTPLMNGEIYLKKY